MKNFLPQSTLKMADIFCNKWRQDGRHGGKNISRMNGNPCTCFGRNVGWRMTQGFCFDHNAIFWEEKVTNTYKKVRFNFSYKCCVILWVFIQGKYPENQVKRSNHCQHIFAAIPKKHVVRYYSLKTYISKNNNKTI